MRTDDSAWRIDAMDGVGGLAFVSWRAMDLIDGQANLDLPSYAITAPDFRPEPLSSRAIGFAATRRGFQLGVWSDGEELSFATLEAVSQFVMRVYVASAGRGGTGGATPRPEGGGRGGGGGGRETPPERPLRPSEDDRETYEDHQALAKFAEELLAQFKLFTTYDAEFHRANFTVVDWRKVTSSETRGTNALLQHCALDLCLEEVLERWVPHSNRSHDQWRRSLAEVLALIAWTDGRDFYNRVEKYRNQYTSNHNLAESLSNLLDYYPWTTRFGVLSDPILTLRQIPLSQDIAKRLGHEVPDRASLFDGLQMMLADPSRVVSPNANASRDCLGLLFLAAQVVVSMSTGRSSIAFWEWSGSYGPSGRLAWQWLVNQLPKGPFPQRVEQVIRAVRTPRTAGPSLTPSPSSQVRLHQARSGGATAV